jgi:hypothetical protein
MHILRTITITLAFLIPVGAIAAPAVRAACCDPPCCPGCPLCDHAQ